MRDRRARMASAGALALLAVGCSIDPKGADAPEPPRASRAVREQQINQQWQNHTLRELVDRWGPPRQLLDIPGGGNPPGSVIVYPRDPATGCVDSFALTHGEVTRVRSYSCR